MKIFLRLFILTFYFFFCSCTTIAFVDVLAPEKNLAAEELKIENVEQGTGVGISGIIIPIFPMWVSRNTFNLEIQLQDTTSKECPVLVLSQGKFKGSGFDYIEKHKCKYYGLPEEGNIVDGNVAISVEWKGKIYPLTLLSSKSFKFDFGLMPSL